MSEFFKFPSTVHVAGQALRDDKVMSAEERDVFLGHELVVEEKVDGANLGISFDGVVRVQNRGEYLRFLDGQWKHLGAWLAPREEALAVHLGESLMLFGEWCYARHSVAYGNLPDWFLGFDIYDREVGAFWGCERRDELFVELGVVPVPGLGKGRFTLRGLEDLLGESRFGAELAEGVYLRYEVEGWLVQRAKLVRAEFMQMGAHWSRVLRPNALG